LGTITSLLQNAAEYIAQVGGTLASMGMSTFVSIFSTIVSVIQSSLNQLVNMLTFIVALFYLLQTDHFVLYTLVASLIPGEEAQNKVIKRCTNMINGIFISTILIAVSHAIITIAVFIFLQKPFMYIAALTSAVIVIFPIFPAQIVFLPIMISEFWQGNMWYSVAIAVGITLLLNSVDDALTDGFLMSNVDQIHPYVTGISIALGMSFFGLNGLAIGPLLLLFTMVVFEVLLSSGTKPVKTAKPEETESKSVVEPEVMTPIVK